MFWFSSGFRRHFASEKSLARNVARRSLHTKRTRTGHPPSPITPQLCPQNRAGPVCPYSTSRTFARRQDQPRILPAGVAAAAPQVGLSGPGQWAVAGRASCGFSSPPLPVPKIEPATSAPVFLSRFNRRRAHTNSAASTLSPRNMTAHPGPGVTSITTPRQSKVKPIIATMIRFACRTVSTSIGGVPPAGTRPRLAPLNDKRPIKDAPLASAVNTPVKRVYAGRIGPAVRG